MIPVHYFIMLEGKTCKGILEPPDNAAERAGGVNRTTAGIESGVGDNISNQFIKGEKTRFSPGGSTT